MYEMDCSGSGNEINHSFLDLLWDDILFLKILPLLPVKELFALRGVSRKSKLLIDSYFKQMKKINLGPYSIVFSIDAFKVLAKNCMQLNELLVPNCIWLTDDLIIPVFENNLNLKKIVLNRCSALTSICLQPVITNCKNLERLCLARCSWLTVGCLQSITLHQHNLVEVDFCACNMIDRLEIINNFLIISISIKVLNISKLSCINDTTLTVIAKYLKNLETLNVSFCRKVTGYGIRSPTGTAGCVLYCVVRGRVVTVRNGRARTAPNITWAKLAHMYFLERVRLSLRSRDATDQRQKISLPVLLLGYKRSRFHMQDRLSCGKPGSFDAETQS